MSMRRARPRDSGVPENETGETGVGGGTWLRALGGAGEEGSISQPPFPIFPLPPATPTLAEGLRSCVSGSQSPALNPTFIHCPDPQQWGSSRAG